MRGLVNFLLGLRAIMLIGSLGAVVGSFVIFLLGSLYLYEVWHVLLQPGDIGGKQLIAPVLEDVDSSFLFGIVLVPPTASRSASCSTCRRTWARNSRPG